MQIIVVLSLLSISITLIVIGYYSFIAYYHPLQKRITKLLSEYEKEHGPCLHYQLILNLSSHPIELHNTYAGFNVRFQKCEVNGFVANKTFYMVVSHPKHQLSSIAKLWSEIGKCHTKFQDMCLAIHPRQLNKLDNMLSHEWLYIQQLLYSAPSVSLLLNDDKLSQSIYYVKEYGTLPNPITIPPYEQLITALQQANKQINQWVQKLYVQRHDLCIYPPISDEQKTHLFQLSESLESKKASLLNIISFCSENNIPLHAICFGMNEFIIPKQNLLARYKQPNLALYLSILAIGLYGSHSIVKNQISTTLSQSQDNALAQQLYTLSRYPQYSNIQKKHLKRLKTSYLDKVDQKPVYEYLLATHKKSDSQLKYHIVNQLTEGKLDKHLVEFLSRKWFKQSYSQKPILSDLAQIISKQHIPRICEVLEPQQTQQCVHALSRIKSYQTYDQALNNLEQTLLPLNIHHYDQSIRQLNYLAQNPKHIGQEALLQLNHMIDKLTNEGHSLLITKAKEIQSIILLLQSSQGQHILHKIKSLHELNHKITSDEEALKLLQKAYMSDRHALRELQYMKNNLALHQAKWLNSMTQPLVQNIAAKANAFLKETWNESIYPELINLQSKFPFSDHQQISPHEMHQTFSMIQVYFDRYIRMFIQEEDGDLVLKPYALGIDIPEHIITTYIYSKVIASGLDIKDDHFHAAWAISLKDMPHPIEAVYLHGANKKQPLQLHKGTVLHWDSRYPVGFDVVLQNGETISIVQNSNWSVLQLFSQFKEPYPLCYQYQAPDQSWSFKVEAKPQYPINLLDANLIESLPFSTW